MSDNVVLTVGTRKGLFLFESDASRDKWVQRGPYLSGVEINHAMLDSRNGTVYATANDAWFGNRVAFSRDKGESWQDNKSSPRFPDGSDRKVERLWRIEPGRDSERDVLWCGADPAVLFSSNDGGDTWVENQALNTHPTRDRWNPGAGGLIVHSIVLDPATPGRMWVAISAAGIFRSDDNGASWQPKNQNVRDVLAKYDPNVEMYPELGQCVHHLVMGGGGRLYAQGHMGTYCSDDAGETWTEITEGLPSDFGMVIDAHPEDPDVAYTLPLIGGEMRVPPEYKLRVFKTTDGGSSWSPMTRGLPQSDAFMGIYREAMHVDRLEPSGVYFGTNTGQLYNSADEGESWRLITANLPPISSVSATVM